MIVIRTQHKTPVLVIYALVNTYKCSTSSPTELYQKSDRRGSWYYLIDWGFRGKTTVIWAWTTCEWLHKQLCWFYPKKEKQGRKNKHPQYLRWNTKCDIRFTVSNKGEEPCYVFTVDFSTNDGLLFRWSKDMDFDFAGRANHGLIPGGSESGFWYAQTYDESTEAAGVNQFAGR